MGRLHHQTPQLVAGRGMGHAQPYGELDVSDNSNLPTRRRSRDHGSVRQGSHPGAPAPADCGVVADQREALAQLVGKLLASEWLRRRRAHSKPGRSPEGG